MVMRKNIFELLPGLETVKAPYDPLLQISWDRQLPIFNAFFKGILTNGGDKTFSHFAG